MTKQAKLKCGCVYASAAHTGRQQVAGNVGERVRSHPSTATHWKLVLGLFESDKNSQSLSSLRGLRIATRKSSRRDLPAKKRKWYA